MKILRYSYTAYAGLIFILTGAIFITLPILLSLVPSWHKAALRLNYFWSHFYMRIVGLPPKIDWRYKPKRKQQYIICANHFSYFDIPVMALMPVPFKFIGKSSITKVPIFGYMFRRLHITVNRSSLRSRVESIQKARESIRQGFNMAFFPEGGVKSVNIPKMVPFRDGAFRLAVEEQLPILPVTLPNNCLILPDDGAFRLRHHPLKVIIHPPVYPDGTGDEAISNLKNKVYRIIQDELLTHHPKEHNIANQDPLQIQS